ncbi:MAG: DUF3124 domain-containing protein [Deltaproteobacteria bacterium]
MQKIAFVAALVLVGCKPPPPAASTSTLSPQPVDLTALTRLTRPESTTGELVYVPIYSSTPPQVGNSRFPLTAILSVHNVALEGRLALTAVTYFDTAGRRLKEMVEADTVLGPLETKQFVIPARDQSGGTGANFVVKWEAEAETPRPVIEALMISTTSAQGVSFTTQGTVIQKLSREAPSDGRDD